ncbi:MAG TPA: SBBP repeat-containing protein [Candidatus Angelobacter sp.]|nr:SBBP repeat-containing protein [Candidatus Angelobacter sp.]
MSSIQRYILAALFFIVSCPFILAAQPPETAARLQARHTLSSVPLAFEPNVGQSEAKTRFIVHRSDLSAGFAADAVTLLLPQKGAAAARLDVDFGRSAQIVPEHELPGKTNYFRGNNTAAWHTGIANFAQIRYSQLWPGTDVVFYGNGEHLEHDFILAPGADPKRICFELKGAQSLETTRNGDLLVHLGGSLITFKKPIAYQETTSGRKQVAANFKLNGTRVSFNLGRYDHRRTLTIDPVLVFSTLLAGSVFDQVTAMTIDAAGNIYVTGDTGSADFPTTPSSVQPACDACNGNAEDAFVTKLNPTGTAMVYSTFIGGSAFDTAHSIVVDSNGNATIAGNTFSSDFPAVNPIGTFTNSNTWHMFVTSLSATGSVLNYSGIVGPLNVLDSFPAPSIPSSVHVPLAVDSTGNVYAAVETIFSGFPTTTGTIAPVPPNPEAAVLVAMKIGTTGSLVYSTAIPGRATPAPPGNFGAPGPNTFFQFEIAVDSTGNSYIAGQANDGLPTTLGVIGPAFASDSGNFVFFPQEGFLLKLNPTGSALVYATYVPGTTRVTKMRLDASNNIFLGGVTNSGALPVSATGFQKDPGCPGCEAVYVLKVNNSGTSVLAGTYLRGAPRNISDQSTLADITLDPSGNVFITGGDPEALNFPMKNPLEQLRGGFIVELSSDLSTLLFSSGGPDAFIQAPSAGKLILASNNGGYPPTPSAFQTTVPPSRGSVFNITNIAAIDLTVGSPVLCRSVFGLSFPLTNPGSTSASQSATVSNCGSADLRISSVTSDSPNFAVTTTCPLSPAAVIPGSSCTVSATYSPVNFQSGNIVIQDDALRSPHDIGLSGSANSPFAFFSPSSLTFLETPVTTTESLSLSIGNTGPLNLTITGLSTTGDYSVSQNCVGQIIPPPKPSPFGPILNFCTVSVNFSPTNTGTRLGTVIVNDTALDTPQTVHLTGLGLAAWPTPVISNGASVDVAGAGANVASSTGSPETLSVIGGGFSRVTTVTLDGILFDNNVRQMTIVNPQQINLNLFDTDFSDSGEVPVIATAPTPGGGTSSTVATITSPIKFYFSIDRTIRTMPSGTIAVGPKSGLIYDSFFNPNGTVSFIAPNINVPSVGVLDPDKEILQSGLIEFPDQSTAIAISDDETFLYAALPSTNTVAQVALPGGAINFRAALGKDPALGNYNADFIAVMPGHPHTWVASLQPTGDTRPIAIKVFDDGVARTNTVEQGNASAIFPGKLLFVGGDTSTVYSIDSTSLYRFTIDANGITLKDKTTGLGAEDFATDGSLIYLSTGAIIDPTTLAVKGTFPLAPGLPMHAVTVDATTHRAIFAGDASVPQALVSLVQAFDTVTLAAKGSFTPHQTFITSMFRWGTNGLVFGGSELAVTRSSLTGTSGAVAPFHIGANFGQAPIPTAQILSGSNAVFNLGIISTNGFNGPVTLSCSNLPQFASCSFSNNPVIPSTNNSSPNGTFTVTISTHQAATASVAMPRSYMRSGSGFILLAGVLSLPFALAMATRKYRGRFLALCLLIAMVGCGGGGGSTGGPTPTPPITPTPTPSGQNTPIGTYDIILTGTSSQGKRQVVLQVIVLG